MFPAARQAAERHTTSVIRGTGRQVGTRRRVGAVHGASVPLLPVRRLFVRVAVAVVRSVRHVTVAVGRIVRTRVLVVALGVALAAHARLLLHPVDIVQLATGEHSQGRHFAATPCGGSGGGMRRAHLPVALFLRLGELRVAVRGRFCGAATGTRAAAAGTHFGCRLRLWGGATLARGLAGVVVDAQMARQLIAAAKTLPTTGIRAHMGFFTRVRADVPRLVLETVKCA